MVESPLLTPLEQKGSFDASKLYNATGEMSAFPLMS